MTDIFTAFIPTLSNYHCYLRQENKPFVSVFGHSTFLLIQTSKNSLYRYVTFTSISIIPRGDFRSRPVTFVSLHPATSSHL